MPIIRFEFGPFQFSSGFTPKEIQGPIRETNVIEHVIPGREGGIVEYLGSVSPKYQIKGFLTASNDTLGGPAGAVLSGTAYVGVSADDAQNFLTGLRGSGAELLRIDSTVTNISGYPILYENDFFTITRMTFGYEAGKTYPYYPYTIDLKRSTPKTFGQGSGTAIMGFGGANLGPQSGYAYAFTWRSGFYTGKQLIALGFNAQSVSSGSARMAIYQVSGPQGTTQGLVAQSASQPINSGWNYFPIRPTLLTMNSGDFFQLAIMTNLISTSGVSFNGLSVLIQGSGTAQFHSGVIYSSGFPDPFISLGPNASFSSGFTSGFQYTAVLVTV